MTAAESFKIKIEKFLERSGMSPTAFGKEAVGDPNFVGDVRDGRMPSLRLVGKVDAYIAKASQPARAAS